MSKRFLTLAAMFMLAASAFAVPAKRVKRQVQQPDGSVLTVMLRGDENFHYTSTEDDQPLVQRADGAYCYATLDSNGKLTASAQVAHDVESRGAAELSFLNYYTAESQKVRSLGMERAKQRNARRMARLANRGVVDASGKPVRRVMAGATGGEGIGVTGKRKGLVILVNFKDKKMQSKHTQAEWNDYFNKVGYNKYGNNGSVHDYFYAQSYGKLDLEFDVIGPVTVSKNMASYGANDAQGNDIDPAGMIKEACELAYAKEKMDMSQYDWDGDGAVDQVYVIYAGYGEAAGGDANTIWPHEWDIQGGGYSLVLGGQRIRTYACSSELNGGSGTYISGIGTACHEFSHCMGIPDFYDTAGGGCFGMDAWDLMDYGSYGGDGYEPTGYNTYEKWVSGWIEPTILTEPCYIKNMKPLSDAPEACVVFNEANKNEYYIFENRQLKGTDVALPNHGMLVIHVDYDQKVWFDNEVNNTSNHQRFTVVPADNKLTSETVTGDTYPGTTKSTELTDTSKPAATLFNANSDGRKFLGKPVTEITEKDGLISFTFMGGVNLDAPQPKVMNMTETSFTGGWNAVDGAESYTVELREKSTQPSVDKAVKLSEDLSKWGEKLAVEGTIDISSDLDSKMQNKGWTGDKVFECPGCAKIGTAKKQGNLTSPLITDNSSASVTVRLSASAYGKDATDITVSLLDNDDATIAEQTITMDGMMATIVLDNADMKDYKVMVQPKKRGYIYFVGIYDGDYSAEDFQSMNVAPKTAMKAAAQRFTGIKTTSYKFDKLTAGITYQWRVCAVAGDAMSKWSAWQTADLATWSGISGVTENLTQLAAGDLVKVYSSVGTALGTMTYGDFCRMALPAGVYVVKSAKTTLKVTK
ncbi:M6 family metalloprotease domain-containing protein [Leyella stercorea]|uniref:M6 family metalloprotease domain-containing protein n=1 Tax=Leyella stercorea TaxID=363265 RepID=UPI0026DBEA6A|nr:M6 family metalloprotease domain-containing protein [Leyella stercorea]